MSESLLAEQSRLKLHVEQLDVFLASEAYRGWETGRKSQIVVTRNDIVDLAPIDRKTEIESFKLRGKLELLEDLENSFQDVRATLNSRLLEIEELLQPNAENNKPNEH